MTAGVGTASMMYGVPAGVSWRRIVEITNLSDPLVGVGSACAFAAAVGMLATFAGPRLAALRWGIVRKVVVALVVTGVCIGVLRGVADAILVPTPDPIDLGTGVPVVGRSSASAPRRGSERDLANHHVAPGAGIALGVLPPEEVVDALAGVRGALSSSR